MSEEWVQGAPLQPVCHHDCDKHATNLKGGMPLSLGLCCLPALHVLNLPVNYSLGKVQESLICLSTSVDFFWYLCFLLQCHSPKHSSKYLSHWVQRGAFLDRVLRFSILWQPLCGVQLLVPPKTAWELPVMVLWPSGESIKMTCTDVHVESIAGSWYNSLPSMDLSHCTFPASFPQLWCQTITPQWTEKVPSSSITLWASL